jgi:GST-like protein
MIDLYTWPTPNGMKVQIMLEETGLPYTVKPVNIIAGEQFDPAYLALNPNNKVPTITDPDGPGGAPITMMETGAILLYLADKTGQFLPATKDDPIAYWDALQWLMWQMGGLGPMFGQAQHFHSYATEDVPYAKERYLNEGKRLLGVLETRLASQDYICGEYSIVDMACFPWVRVNKMCGLSLKDWPKVSRWYGAIRARPAVEVGINVLMDRYIAIANSDEGKETLFGSTQYTGQQ